VVNQLQLLQAVYVSRQIHVVQTGLVESVQSSRPVRFSPTAVWWFLIRSILTGASGMHAPAIQEGTASVSARRYVRCIITGFCLTDRMKSNLWWRSSKPATLQWNALLSLTTNFAATYFAMSDRRLRSRMQSSPRSCPLAISSLVSNTVWEQPSLSFLWTCLSRFLSFQW